MESSKGEQPVDPFERAVAGLALGAERDVAKIRAMLRREEATADRPSLRKLEKVQEMRSAAEVEEALADIVRNELPPTPRNKSAAVVVEGGMSLLTCARLPLFSFLWLLPCVPCSSLAESGDREVRPCESPVSGLQALCKSIPVPENWSSPDGRTISLNVMILRGKRELRQPDPFFVLVGGPGQAASEGAGWIAAAFATILDRRDIVLIDVRGTGKSQPIQCAAYAGSGLQRFLGPAYTKESAEECSRRLMETADLKHYNSLAAVRDMEHVRLTLGYPAINLYGTSYGTRLAMAYMKEYPQHVRTAALESVFPTPVSPLVNAPLDAERTLRILIQDCERDPRCAAAFKNLRVTFQNVLNNLRIKQATVHLTLRDGKSAAINISADAFATGVRNLLYTAGTARYIPLIIERAAHGDFDAFARFTIRRGQGYEQGLSHAVFLCTACSELYGRVQEKSVLTDARSSFLGDSSTRMLLDVCRVWPHAELPASFFEPLRCDVPVLLLSGWLDPAAPPRWAEEASLHMRNSLHLVIRDGHHNFSDLSPRGCTDSIIAALVEKGRLDGLDTTCVTEMHRPEFAITPQEFPEIPIEDPGGGK
ncbi:MAG: alpha/beta hydrolase [Acidobacteria bacterium]|nr:alpha/beta hydrolase [Acidobacteriota bacterium]